jgi:hypothetical protein
VPRDDPCQWNHRRGCCLDADQQGEEHLDELQELPAQWQLGPLVQQRLALFGLRLPLLRVPLGLQEQALAVLQEREPLASGLPQQELAPLQQELLVQLWLAWRLPSSRLAWLGQPLPALPP